MDKITVQRANVVLDIDPENKDFYMSQGYSVIDKFGNVVEETIPTDVNTLRVRIGELAKQLADAEKTIAQLNRTIEELKSTTVEKPVVERQTRSRRSKE